MNKIEPMTVEKIKELVARYRAYIARGIDSTTLGDLGPSLVLAWAEERAMKNRAEHPDTCEQCLTAYHDKDKCHRARWATFAEWLNEVLEEINWPKDNR